MTAANITNLPATNVAPLPLPPASMPRGSALADPERFNLNLRAADLFASSDLVPVQFRGKPANCFIAINAAQRLGVDEFYFLQKSFVVGGKLGMAAELFIELVNNSGRFRGPMRFRLHGEGDQRAATASATLLDGTAVESTVTYAMAKADGWTRNSKWQSLTDQMLSYRAGTFLGRLYAGGVAGGINTRDELEDIAAASARDVTPEAKQIEPPRPPRSAQPPSPAQREASFPLSRPPLEVVIGDGWDPAKFPRGKKGLREALEFMTGAVCDGKPQVVGLNNQLLDDIAEHIPELAGEVSELRAAAAEALKPKDEDETQDTFVRDFVNGDDDTFPGDLPSKEG